MKTTELIRSTYDPADVTYLVRETRPTFVTVREKERLIQSGEAHYGQLLSPERPPGAAYMALFEDTLAGGGQRFASQVLRLAQLITAEHARRAAPGPVVLVSLARGGTPIGALVARALRHQGAQAVHYGVSIVRDHGLDFVALDLLRERHPDAGVHFVDGWTGKGVIARELRDSALSYNASRQAQLVPDLSVISDPGGFAARRATHDDELVPNAMLGATVSGLLSRTLLPARPGELHGAAFLADLAPHDVTNELLDRVSAHFGAVTPAAAPGVDAPGLREQAQTFLTQVLEHHGERPLNHVKPGVGEATRVLLRRGPELLIVRDRTEPRVRHLLDLARERNVPVREWNRPTPFAACALIRSADRDP